MAKRECDHKIARHSIDAYKLLELLAHYKLDPKILVFRCIKT